MNEELDKIRQYAIQIEDIVNLADMTGRLNRKPLTDVVTLLGVLPERLDKIQNLAEDIRAELDQLEGGPDER